MIPLSAPKLHSPKYFVAPRTFKIFGFVQHTLFFSLLQLVPGIVNFVRRHVPFRQV